MSKSRITDEYFIRLSIAPTDTHIDILGDYLHFSTLAEASEDSDPSKDWADIVYRITPVRIIRAASPEFESITKTKLESGD